MLDLGLPDRLVLFKTDAVVEGIHFTTETPPEQIGHKALARCLSDIAAMAGIPNAALITLGLPQGFDPARIEKIYAGMGALARKYEVAIVGGETTTNPGQMLISVSLIGTAPRGRCVLRSGALAGDAIFVTGELGGSFAGRHLEFEPRLHEARWLSENFEVHSMIDISDGLAGDLRHIMNASRVGAELLSSAIPASRAAKQAAKSGSLAKPALVAALTDGEDFELLFTLPGKDAVALLDAWKEHFPKLKLSCIGKMNEREGLTIRDRQGVRQLDLHGYEHFQ